MKNAFFLLPLLAMATAARADVAWEHRGTVTIGTGSPVAFMLLKNEWSGSNHRAALTLDATKAASMMGPFNNKPVRAQVNLIERLDDDRILLSLPDNKTYVDEPLKSLKGRLRLNFWEALGADLSPSDIPELTLAQRQRLGREIAGLVSPLTRKFTRNYFRALPEKRTIGGLSSRGYRFVSLTNFSAKKSEPQWVRTTAEWWLADELEGDQEIRAFTQNANQSRGSGGTTASMWLNEMPQILWQAAPPQMHEALASLVGESSSSGFGFTGTPVQFFVTVTPPPSMQMALGGEVRLALQLTKRDSAPLDSTIFEAPGGHEKVAIEPFLGMARNVIKMGRTEIDKMLKQ
jgi:hypothetical protein